MPKRLFVIGVGPGDPDYIIPIAKEKIQISKYIIGYKYTLTTIEKLLDKKRQQIYEINMRSQESTYQQVYEDMNDDEYCTVPFTGDVNFSESEVVDRLLEIFGNENVEVIPGISSIQIASSKSKVPLDKASIISFHVTGNIKQKKMELLKSVSENKSVILLPRPWPNDLSKNFMPADIALFLKDNGIDTRKINVWVFEYLTNKEKETTFKGKLIDLEDKTFSDLSVMIIDQNKSQTYLEF
ncbi:MAG TPA: precorrin-6y C5,15-methyltransferase (decarboxylating) subunit CbiE [Nitrososphaeraceae archaeon]|nr:precorrin-6y C5,15-methyltransferase (decarboxylating) subunit CbiE [Nitrososphaeraceae archaeon]